jgi:hypothetical protein
MFGKRAAKPILWHARWQFKHRSAETGSLSSERPRVAEDGQFSYKTGTRRHAELRCESRGFKRDCFPYPEPDLSLYPWYRSGEPTFFPRPGASAHLRLRGRGQCHGRFAGKQQKGKRLLQIQSHSAIGMAEIADGNILSNMQVEIAAARGKHKRAGDGRRPSNFTVYQPLDVLQHGASVVTNVREVSSSIWTPSDAIPAARGEFRSTICHARQTCEG